MDFTFNEQISYWESPAKVMDLDINLRIIEGYAESELEPIARKTIAKVEDGWAKIQKNIGDSLLDMYNETWCDPEEGLPQLSREDFLGKISLNWIDVMEDDSLSLYFNDADMFGGHVIDVFWTPEKMYDAAIAG